MVEVEEGISTITVDRNKLVQVLINLIENAMHAMPEGGTVTLSVTQVDEDSRRWLLFPFPSVPT